jgi:TolB-like protein
MPRRRIASPSCVLALGFVLSACTAAYQPPPAPTAAEIPQLEAQLALHPADARVIGALALSYRSASRLEDARDLLQRSPAPGDPNLSLLLGLTYEDLGQYSDADEIYRTLLRTGVSRQLRSRVAGRQQLVQREAWRQMAREALEREQELSGRAAEPAQVAVFPFRMVAADEALRPLARALADMLVTDLSQTDRLRILERAQVQMLIDEMRLAEEGLVDPNTAARSGQMLGAGRIVQGLISGSEEALELEAAVVSVERGVAAGIRPIAERDHLRELFQMQKRLALQIYSSLGIQLSPAEEERVTRQRTSNLQALLAYGFGLESEDGGDLSGAAAWYSRAVGLDRNFEPAVVRLEAVQSALDASETPTQQVARASYQDLLDPFANLAAMDDLLPTPRSRSPASEVLGQDGLLGSGVILINVQPR